MDKARAGQLFDIAADIVAKYGNTNTPLETVEEYTEGFVSATIVSKNAKKETVVHINPEFQAVLAFAKSIAKTQGVRLGAPRGRSATWSVLDQFLEDNSFRAVTVSKPTPFDGQADTYTVQFTVKTITVETPTTEEA